MLVTGLELRDFRSYERAQFEPAQGITVVSGRNGAGKTNLLEGLYFACTGRSCRTTNEREVVRFGCSTTRTVLRAHDQVGEVELTVGFAPGEPKRMRADGQDVDRLADVERRPLVSVFLPDRLELVKGPPALRRSHLDALVAALWPARAATRRAYAQALAQRNALLSRVRAGRSPASSLDAWDAELARSGVALSADRDEAVAVLARRFAALAAALGLEGEALLEYRPRSRARESEQLEAELRERRASDLERGFSGHGPHRDDVSLSRDRRELRAYGSQGEQRIALLALLLAEREAIGRQRDRVPLMLLDDVMSELDAGKRELLVSLLGEAGQSLVTTTETAHVPSTPGLEVGVLELDGETVLAPAARR